MAYIDCENCYHGKVCQYRRIYHDSIVACEDWQPTADVVPKSEYDAAVSALDNSTKEFLKLHDDYQEAKSEVERLYYNLQAVLEERAETKQEIAREIFEEIERLIGLYTVNTPIHMPFNYIDVLFAHYVAALKVKYTEDKT